MAVGDEVAMAQEIKGFHLLQGSFVEGACPTPEHHLQPAAVPAVGSGCLPPMNQAQVGTPWTAWRAHVAAAGHTSHQLCIVSCLPALRIESPNGTFTACERCKRKLWTAWCLQGAAAAAGGSVASPEVQGSAHDIPALLAHVRCSISGHVFEIIH